MPAFLQKRTEIPLEKTATEKSELLKPKVSEDSENAAGTGRGNPKISSDSQNPSRPAANPASEPDQQDSLKSGKSGPKDTKFDSDSETEKRETSDPARRVVAKNENSNSASDAPNADEAKSKEPFKRHDHAKYLEMIKNKAVDMVNSDKESSSAKICKDVITDQWSLTLYYVKEKTYKFVTYTWDEIDDDWKKSFTSNKGPLSGLKRHLKYSSSGKDCKPLKKERP